MIYLIDCITLELSPHGNTVCENQRGTLEVSFKVLIWWSFLFKPTERDVICLTFALSKGKWQSKVEWSKGRFCPPLRASEPAPKWDAFRAQSDMGTWGWGCSRQGSWDTWRLQTLRNTRNRDRVGHGGDTIFLEIQGRIV